MNKHELLELFFNQTFEGNINKEMLNYDYIFPYEDIKEYVSLILDVPLHDFIERVRSKVYLAISCKEITQYSSLNDATSRYCQILDENGDKGYKFEDVGRLLLNDGINRAVGAYRKYGENHSKTACQLGLAQNIYNNFYLSSLGKIFNTLDDAKKKALLARTILRNPLYGRIFSLLESRDVNIAQLCQSLSASTIIRRRSNVLKLCKIVSDEYQREGNHLEHIISFIVD